MAKESGGVYGAYLILTSGRGAMLEMRKLRSQKLDNDCRKAWRVTSRERILNDRRAFSADFSTWKCRSSLPEAVAYSLKAFSSFHSDKSTVFKVFYQVSSLIEVATDRPSLADQLNGDLISKLTKSHYRWIIHGSILTKWLSLYYNLWIIASSLKW